MSEMPADGKTQCVSLPAVLDATAAVALRETLAGALAGAESVEIAAGDVQRMTTPGLQVLAAAARSFAEQGVGFRFTACTPAFLEAADTLALGPALGLEGGLYE